MSRYWSPLVHRLTPYIPGEQRADSDIVKLNTNENPYPPSPQVMAAIAAVQGRELRRYPKPESDSLRGAIGRYHEVSPNNVFVGNGSDEILALAFMAFFTGRGALQYPVPSYSFYPVYCNLYGIDGQPVPLDSDFQLRLEDFIVSAEADAGGIIFPNPNAPTGGVVGLEAIEALLERHAGVVLVDEAYVDFGADSAIPLIARYPNLIVSRTFSKGRSLAGLRLGYAIAGDELMDGLRRVKNSFNSYPVDVAAEAAGIASLEDEHTFRQTVTQVVNTREHVVGELRARGFTVLPSAANFVFARPEDGNAAELAEFLAAQGILVRHWHTAGIESWMRVSIGTDEDMTRLLGALDARPSDADRGTGTTAN